MQSQPNWSNRILELFEWPDLSKTKATDEACKWLQANPTVWENWLPDATKCFPQFGLYNRAKDRLGPWSWIFVMVLGDNFCQQKRARNLLFLRRCKNIPDIYRRGCGNMGSLGFEGYKWWYSQPFYFSWSESVVFHLDGLAQSPPEWPKIGANEGDNSPRNLKHPAYFVTEFEQRSSRGA